MSKKYLFLIILFICGSTSAFSLDINLAKESYYPGETLQAEVIVEGSLEENIANQNLKFYCSDDSISISPSVIKLNDSHYYSFFKINENIPSQNCNLVFEDIIFYDSGFLKQDDFNKNFSLTATNGSVVSISPAGFRVDDLSTQNNFKIYVENLGIDPVNLSISTEEDFVELSLSDLSGVPETSSYFEVYLSEFLYNGEPIAEVEVSYGSNNYKIPFWIFEDPQENFTQPVENNSYIDGPFLDFVMDVEEFNISLNSEEDLSGYVTIKNVGVDLINILFNLTGNLNEVIDLQTEKLDNLAAGDTFKEYLYVNQLKDADEGVYEGSLKIDYYSESIEFPITVEIVSGEVVINGTGDNGDPVDPGEPQEDETSFSIWWIVLIFLLLALIIVYLLYRKKTKTNPDFLPPHV